MVYATAPGKGFDYYVFDSLSHPSTSRHWPEDGKLTLQFGPTQKVAIRTRGADGRPVVGAKLWLWLLSKPGEPDQFSFSSVPGPYRVTTDKEGVAHFDDLPAWPGTLTFWPDRERFANRRIKWDRGRQLEVRLDELVPLSGHVRFADGRPAAGIGVVATGNDYSEETFRGQATTDADGRYEMKVPPEALLIFGVEDDKWARRSTTELSPRLANRRKTSISPCRRRPACTATCSNPMDSRSPGICVAHGPRSGDWRIGG